MKPLVVFVCTGNCIRSQMAEGLLRALGGERFDVASAGVSPAGFVHELAIEAMKEIGVDIEAHESKGLAEAMEGMGSRPPLLVMLCEHALSRFEAIPSAVRMLEWIVDDPVHAQGPREERLVMFRRIRDQLRGRIERALASRELQTAAEAIGAG
jgi:arsenate reductase